MSCGHRLEIVNSVGRIGPISRDILLASFYEGSEILPPPPSLSLSLPLLLRSSITVLLKLLAPLLCLLQQLAVSCIIIQHKRFMAEDPGDKLDKTGDRFANIQKWANCLPVQTHFYGDKLSQENQSTFGSHLEDN